MANSNTISILIQAKDEASKVLKSLGESFNGSAKSFQAAGKQMSKTGNELDKYVTLPLVGLGVGALKMAGDFEQSLNILQSVTGATNSQMTALRKTARDLGNDVSLPGISAKDAAGAMTELAKAGLSVNDTMDASKGVLSLAKAGQIDVADAANTTARALNAFQLKGSDANKIADLLAASANASTASVSDMALGLQMAGAQSHNMGVSLNDTVTALALFSNAGINGSDAGTSLKQMFLQLATPTKEAAGLMDTLGLKFFDAKGNFIGLANMSQLLRDKLSGLTVEQRNNALATIFGSDATRVASVLAQNGADGFNAMATAVGKSGAATELAAAQNKGFNGALDNLKSTAETAFIDIGTNLLPLVTRELKGLTDMVGRVSAWFSSLSTGQQDFIFHTLTMVALLGPAVLVLGKFASAIGNIVSVTTAVSRAFGLFETAGVVARAGAATSALGGAGLAGAAEGATGALAGGGGLLAALGPIGLGLLATAAVAGGAYLAYRHFKDAGDDVAASLKGVDAANGYALQSTSFLTLAQDNQKRAADDVSRATNTQIQTQEAHSRAIRDNQKAHEDLKLAQDRVKQALDDFGANSPQYQEAVHALSDKQSTYDDNLLREWSLGVDVSKAEEDLKGKRQELTNATGELIRTQDILNGGLSAGLDVVASWGPTALQQVGPIMQLQGAIGSAASAWTNVNINIQSQIPNLVGHIQGLSSTIQNVQGQNNTLNASLQRTTNMQMSLGGAALQGGKSPQHALGTNYAPGGRTLVGEHGPEFVDLPKGSKVYDADHSRGMGSGSVTNVILSGTFNFENADASTSFFNRLDKTQRLAAMGMA